MDVNLPIALLDASHVHHQAARIWFLREGRKSWVTCSITQLGFVRIVSHATYPGSRADVQTAIKVLSQFRAAPEHTFWAADIEVQLAIAPGAIINASQVTDIYLLAMAVQHGGKLATIDRRIPRDAVAGGAQALEIVPV